MSLEKDCNDLQMAIIKGLSPQYDNNFIKSLEALGDESSLFTIEILILMDMQWRNMKGSVEKTEMAFISSKDNAAKEHPRQKYCKPRGNLEKHCWDTCLALNPYCIQMRQRGNQMEALELKAEGVWEGEAESHTV